ncbi:branched-chain amino acid transport system permease protein [Caldalkalibacillus uzonensis]|uniref:Branched-chain amino acid transport system permease protein n=1 Tax=Caldalkalibacillus uzonensis TaxID=353224 RepID=A0ABU0CSW6_9BACI|nr:branched-chain amino acid ABC transporter permease [Caldalkalibacillus uzonensis]MDQ0338959.1 branched-chain amino acid transport system permease protein [Caldalkalibacillus uzonensis]
MKGVQQTNWRGFFIFTALVLIFPLLISKSFYITQATFAGIYTIVAIGLGLLMGYAGQISLGQAAFYGVGAYTTAVLTATMGVSPWLSLLFALLIPALLAWVMGHTMSRLSGYYLAMATLAFGIIVNVLLVEWRSVTYGASGFYGIPNIELFGLRLTQGTTYYYFVWTIGLLVLAVSLNIVHSRIGRALRSIHDSEIASGAMGVDTGKYKMQIFILSAMFAGLAGWLFAHMSYSISPSSFGLDASILFLVMVVLGGSTSVWGAVIGALLITSISVLVHNLGLRFSFISSDFEHVLYGLILMLVIIFMPRGLFPTLVDWLKTKGWTTKVSSRADKVQS